MFPNETKFLLIDDSTFTRNMLKKSLSEMGFFNFLEAADAKKAQVILLEEIKAGAPVQCVISDVNMPNMSGLALVEWCRATDVLKGIPIVLLTCNQEKSDVLNALRLGVTQYVIKPFDTPTMKERLKQAWDKHGKAFAGTKAS